MHATSRGDGIWVRFVVCTAGLAPGNDSDAAIGLSVCYGVGFLDFVLHRVTFDRREVDSLPAATLCGTSGTVAASYGQWSRVLSTKQ